MKKRSAQLLVRPCPFTLLLFLLADWEIFKDFAKDLLAKLPAFLDNSSTETLLADVNHHIHTVNLLAQKAGSLSYQAVRGLKDCGRKLWNDCIKERRKNDNSSLSVARLQLFVRVRLFAFLILMMAAESNHGEKDETGERVVYLLNWALIVGRTCIDGSDLDGARLGLHKVADYVERLKAMDERGNSQEDHAMTKKFEAEYLTMRMALVSLERQNTCIANGKS